MLISSLQINIIYITSCIILGLILLALLVVPLARKNYLKNHFNRSVHKKVMSLANYYDYYLINNVPVITKGEHVVSKIDHLLLTNKYIYAIKDVSFKEPVSATVNDMVWLSYSKAGIKHEFYNPILLNMNSIDKFASSKNLDRNYFISVLVVNDDAYIESGSELNSSNSFVCKKKDLKKLIGKIEKRNVSTFNLKKLDTEVKKIYESIGREENE